MKIGEYQIIRYRPRYLDQVSQLLVPLCGPDLEINRAYFQWKHMANPYAPGIIHLALHGDDQVVGISTFHPYCWQAGHPGRRFLCLANADAVVHPDHRRKGLLQKFIEVELKAVQDDFDFIITLSAAPASCAAVTKMGWCKVGELGHLEWRPPQGDFSQLAGQIPGFTRIRRLLASFRQGPPQPQTSHPLPHFHQLDSAFFAADPRHRDGIVLESEPRPAHMTRLANRLDSGRIRHVRDEVFYRWRFRNPLSVYRFLFWEREGFRGYMVLHKNIHNHGNTTTIVDWESERPEIFQDLVQAAILWGGFHSISICTTTLDAGRTNLLRSLGFRESAHQGNPDGAYVHPILIRSLRGAETMGGYSLKHLPNWDMRAIFSDCY